jgi:hypothetical protein
MSTQLAVHKMFNRLMTFEVQAVAAGDDELRNKFSLLMIDLADIVEAIKGSPAVTEEIEHVHH